jgi:hypothetical protein
MTEISTVYITFYMITYKYNLRLQITSWLSENLLSDNIVCDKVWPDFMFIYNIMKDDNMLSDNTLLFDSIMFSVG